MTSPSTLIRKARLAESRGHKAAAKRLRAEAAKLRRAERRKAKTPKKAKRAKQKKAAKTFAALRSRALPAIDQQERNPLDEIADRVLGKNGSLEMRIALRRELIEARKTGENNAAAMYADRLKGQQEAARISVVCGFIAEVEGMQRVNGGSLPALVTTSGSTIARVYDALRKAGYTRDGINGGGIAREQMQWRRNPTDNEETPQRG